MSSTPIYLDHAATTPMDARVLEHIVPLMGGSFGNPASRQHQRGREAAAAVEEARGQVALLLGADPREIVLTSGATEANNLALRGVVQAPAHAQRPRRILTARTEHHAVLEPLDALEASGCEVIRLGVDARGHIDLDELASELARGALLVSLMAANNETGLLHPLERIGELCREHGALFHTDATQLVGKQPIDVDRASIDLLSLSGHKLYGPMGVGALYLRRKRPRVRVEAQLLGGGHEAGRRAGTPNLPAIAGLGLACALRAREGPADEARIAGLRDRFEAGLMGALDGVSVNGDAGCRLAGHANLAFAGVDADSLLERLIEVQASSSAACTSALRQPSHVLREHGYDAARVASSVRFSLGKGTTVDDVDRAVEALIAAIGSLG